MLTKGPQLLHMLPTEQGTSKKINAASILLPDLHVQHGPVQYGLVP